MSHYAIGDVQGCFAELQALLEKIQFDKSKDQLWFAGDLINRGPASLEVLRFVKGLGKSQRLVLGNHDLHLLASWTHGKTISAKDTLTPILTAPDCDELCDWLRHQALLVADDELPFIMVHAGLLPQWSISQAQGFAKEVESILQGEEYKDFLRHMYSNEDDSWHENLAGQSRWRTLVNVFTRLRYCDQAGNMALTEKGAIGTQRLGLIPWFMHPERKTLSQKILFGHWAALNGRFLGEYNVFSLDTGCVWGRSLRALRLEDQQVFEVASQQDVK